eukprot:6181939-Pleurochrysis_carterae.AAC.1
MFTASAKIWSQLPEGDRWLAERVLAQTDPEGVPLLQEQIASADSKPLWRCACAAVRLCARACLRKCVRACVGVCVRLCIRACVRVCVCTGRAREYTRMRACVSVRECVSACVCVRGLCSRGRASHRARVS